MSDDRNDRPGREILFEYIVMGNAAKVTAIDAATGREASVVGPAHAPRAALERLALAKLDRKPGEPEDGRGGIVV